MNQKKHIIQKDSKSSYSFFDGYVDFFVLQIVKENFFVEQVNFQKVK